MSGTGNRLFPQDDATVSSGDNRLPVDNGFNANSVTYDPATGLPYPNQATQDFSGINPLVGKAFGVGGYDRYQFFPERIIRSGATIAHDMTTGKVQPGSQEEMDRAMDMAALAGGGTIGGTAEGTVAKLASDTAKPGMAVAGFYSAAENAIKNAKMDKGSPEQWVNYIKNQPGVKQEELQWTGLDDPKNLGDGQITKDQMQQYIDNHKVQVNEINKGGPIDRDAIQNRINEINDKLDTYDDINEDMNSDEAMKRLDLVTERWNLDSKLAMNNSGKYAQYVLPGGNNYKESLLTLPEKNASNDIYTSGHFDEPNILAHVRTTDRDIPGVGNSLHLEEVQSDWHQAGRKQGYKLNDADSAKFQSIDDKLANSDDEEILGHPDISEALKMAVDRKILTPDEANFYKQNSNNNQFGSVPNAPFKTTWADLSLKRMIRQAAEEGKDAISWTPGEAIPTNPKNMGQQGASADKANEGMKMFYDKMLPDKANALAKKFGGKVEDEKLDNGQLAHVLRLTPQLKDAALQKGFPLFSATAPGLMLTPVDHNPHATTPIDYDPFTNPGAT